MPTYTVKETSFVDNKLLAAGSTIEFDGLPGPALEPTCDEGKARAKQAEASRRKALDDMIRNYQPPTGGLDQERLASLIGAAVASGVAQALAAQKEPAKGVRSLA